MNILCDIRGRLKTEKEYGDIIISTDNSGQTLHLRDVADVKLGGLMYSVSMLNNGEPSCCRYGSNK